MLVERTEAVRNVVMAAAIKILPGERLNLSDWADKNFCLSSESSHMSGKWKSYPFQIGWMDAFSNDEIKEVVVIKSRRVGYTKTLLALLAYSALCLRRNQAVWLPTDEDRNRFVKDELDPMIRDVELLSDALIDTKEKNTIRRKEFKGSKLNLLGGRTHRSYRGLTIDTGIIDEASAFDYTIGTSISPIEAVRGRLEGSPYPKLIIGSTPRIKGLDHIDSRASSTATLLHYHIPCIHCGNYHQLYFGDKSKTKGLCWEHLKHGRYEVWHICPICKGTMTQPQYLEISDKGKWISMKGSYVYGNDRVWRDSEGHITKPPETVTFSIWAAYSPQRIWEDIVEEFIKAKEYSKTGDLTKMILFANETLGQAWEPTHEKTNEHTLAKRAENYNRYDVPEGGLVLLAGIDTQDDRWEATTWAYGRGGEMWVVDYSVLRGSPSNIQDWFDNIDKYLDTEFTHKNGKIMKITSAAIDVMGHYTQTAYNYCRLRTRRGVYAIRGSSFVGSNSVGISAGYSTQRVIVGGRPVADGVTLWNINTHVAKDIFYNRCKIDKPGPGYVHFYKSLPAQFYTGLTAERRVQRRTKRGLELKWENLGDKPNEPLDTTVYSLFLAEVLNLSVRTEESWKRLEKKVFDAKKETGEDMVGIFKENKEQEVSRRRRQIRDDLYRSIGGGSLIC